MASEWCVECMFSFMPETVPAANDWVKYCCAVSQSSPLIGCARAVLRRLYPLLVVLLDIVFVLCREAYP